MRTKGALSQEKRTRARCPRVGTANAADTRHGHTANSRKASTTTLERTLSFGCCLAQRATIGAASGFNVMPNHKVTGASLLASALTDPLGLVADAQGLTNTQPESGRKGKR